MRKPKKVDNTPPRFAGLLTLNRMLGTDPKQKLVLIRNWENLIPFSYKPQQRSKVNQLLTALQRPCLQDLL